MKHNLKLIQQILEQAATDPLTVKTADIKSKNLAHHPKAVVRGHIDLLIEKKLLDASKSLRKESDHIIHGLTQEGHGFFEAIKNRSVKKKIRETEKKLGKEVTLEVVIEIVKDFAIGLIW
jgi:hypothetical protein